MNEPFTGNRWHLAQVNVARMRAPLEDPLMEGFVARLDEINRIADEAPGFIWRLQTDEGDATAIRAFGDDSILVNLSLWESIETLREYVYGSLHRELLRDRAEWFAPPTEPHLALWWIPAGRLPTVEESARRLERLRHEGPGPAAFTFKQAFPEPAAD